MKDVDYHKVGERFEYEGVTLEVKEAVDISVISCDLCYLRQMCSEIRYSHQPPIRNCSQFSRKDRKTVYYVPVDDDYEHKTEQVETKDMEQKEVIEEKSDERIALRDKETGRLIAVKGKFNDEDLYKSFLNKLFTTYKAKDKDYGSAFSEMFDELGIDYAYGKLREKINRIKVLRKHPNMVENEGLEDALLDTAGYAILTLVELKKRNNGN